MNLKGGKSQVLSIVPKSNYKYFDLLRFCGYAQKLNNPGCKFTTGKMFAYTVIGSISLWSRNSYCADGFCTISDYLIRFSSGASHIGENLRRTMLLTGKLMVMLFLFLTVWLNWGQSEPMYFAAKVTLIFLFTKPVPSSIYIFVDQERLNQVLMEKKKESRSGMEIMNLLQKEGRQRGTWSAKKANNDFYKKIVDAYEAKNQELAAENADLRALLRSMQLSSRKWVKIS